MRFDNVEKFLIFFIKPARYKKKQDLYLLLELPNRHTFIKNTQFSPKNRSLYIGWYLAHY